MIAPVARKAIKDLLGKNPTQKIQNYFKKNKVVNRDQKVYSYNYISSVLSGLKENPTVEAGIWACARHYIKKRQEEKAAKESLVESIKEVIDESAA